MELLQNLRSFYHSFSLTKDVSFSFFFKSRFSDSSLVTYLVNFIKSHELLDKPVELMCHPGFVDKDLIKRSNYLDKRKLELEVFLDPELPKLLKSYNINLL